MASPSLAATASRSRRSASAARRRRRLNFLYLTTVGRVSGQPREIEIWFAREGDTLYMLAGGGRRADWVRNIMREPAVSVRLGEETLSGHGRVVDDPAEDALARELVGSKYDMRGTDWQRTALPVAVDLII